MEHRKNRKNDSDRELDLSLFENQKIVDINMEKEVRKSFIEYSMSVIIARALPDVRDGMKPGQRRILYAMYEDNLTHDNPFRKSATTVGNVLGRYHPHGDAAVYGTMVRMAQPFSFRYPLVEGHGNFGSVDGDPPAAYRYTEARLDKIADEMTRDIDKNAVNMVPNFDNSRVEPEVLPSRFPNFLVNGAVGIAVGMATNVPTHNLGEVVDATVYRMEHPDCSVDELMEFIKGPDFPTAGIIYGTNGIKEAYRTGQGRITVRARAEVDEEKRQIIITEIPYMVNKSTLCAAIGDLVKDKRIEGITDLRDESGRDGMRIVVDYRRDVNGQIILNQLYKFSQLQDTCSVNMLAVVNGEPRVLTLCQVLDEYISFQDSVIRRRTQFDLDKALARAHILEGYQVAIQNIDEIVEIMKRSPSIPEAKLTLMDRYSLSDVQAQAIVDMTIGRLTGLETQKIENELAKLEGMITEFRAILADDSRVRAIIRDELLAIRTKYADERRTEIVQATDDILLEDLIERHNCVITLTHSGYIKRLPADTYSVQHRGGKGVIGMATKEEDFIERVIAMCSHDYLMMFTNTGKVHTRKAFMIPEASRTAKGQNLVNILQLQPEEKVTAVISIPGFDETAYLTMVTRNGIIKRTALSEFEYQRKGGKIAIHLDEGDELVFVMCTHGEKDIILATRNGSAVRFSEVGARTMGRTARGVRGIRLREGDYVTGVAAVTEGKTLVTVTENGFGKRTSFDDFRLMKNRGGMGVACHNINSKTGKLAGIAAVSEDEDLMLITDAGVIVRTPVRGINLYSRTASGVICMRLGEGQRLIGFTSVPAEPEEDEDVVITDADETGVTGVTGAIGETGEMVASEAVDPNAEADAATEA